MFTPFWKFSLDTAMLALESQAVIAMRMTNAALGLGTHAETTRMCTEKVAAFAEAAAAVAGGGSAHRVVRRYRKHVRANVRRLRSAR
jgi:hypothetical protein